MEDLVYFHSNAVDPKEVSVSTSLLHFLAMEQALTKCPYTRMHLVVSQYSNEKTKAQFGGPGLSMFLGTNTILNLCKKTDLLQRLENQLRELKARDLPFLESKLSLRMAKLELAVWALKLETVGHGTS